MTVHIGFTGTRTGMTEEQKMIIGQRLKGIEAASPEMPVLHLGACVGADTNAHILAWPSYKIVLHPPTNQRFRSFVEHTEMWRDDVDVVLPTEDYLARNAAIVRCSALLLATPDGEPRTRSGTWATVRMAAKAGLHTVIVMPDGEIR